MVGERVGGGRVSGRRRLLPGGASLQRPFIQPQCHPPTIPLISLTGKSHAGSRDDFATPSQNANAHFPLAEKDYFCYNFRHFPSKSTNAAEILLTSISM